MAREDWLVLCALTLPLARAFEEIMKPACFAEPKLVLHPSVKWWAQVFGAELVEHVTRGNQK